MKKAFVLTIILMILCVCSLTANANQALSVTSDYSVIENHKYANEIKNLLNEYAAFRNANLLEVTESEVFSSSIKNDAQNRGITFREELNNVDSEIISGETSFRVDLIQGTELSEEYQLDVYEWVFYTYEENGFQDISGYGFNHEIKISVNDGQACLTADSYYDDLINFESISYDTSADADSENEMQQEENVRGTISAALSAPIPGIMPSDYSVEKFVEYADKYALNYNPAYTNYNPYGGDCASFGSQCMAAGGLTQDLDWYYNSIWDISKSWISSTAQRTALSKYAEIVDNPTEEQLFPGNPVYYGYTKKTGYSHTAVCVDYNSAGTPLVNAHNSDRYRVNWKLGSSWTKRSTILLVKTGFRKKDYAISTAVSGNVVTLNWQGDETASGYNIKISSAKTGEVVYKADSVKNTTVSTILQQGDYNVTLEAIGTKYRWLLGNAASFSISVYADPIDADTHGFILSVGETAKINATVTPASFTSYFPLVYTSSDTKVAAVDQSGNIKAAGIGSAVIKISVGSFTFDCAVTVRTQVNYSENIKAYRLYGKSRFDTAIDISDKGWDTAETVILANGMNFADALSGVPLSYALDAPILLTQGLDTIEPEVLAQIEALKAKNVVILGGEMVISKGIASSLSSYNVSRIYGKTRYETCVAIAKEVERENSKIPDTVIISTGLVYADALSISTYAAKKGYPIFYVDSKSSNVDENLLSYINDRAEIENVIIIGGTSAVTENHASALSKNRNVVRIAGSSRYDTSMQIYKQFGSEFGSDIFFATGENFPDALSGAGLAAKWNCAMILANPKGADSVTKNYFATVVPNDIYMLGGGRALPAQSVVDSFRKS